MSETKYCPEIDGLRAVAIILVILYHASFQIGNFLVFSGGYIGVDVFFVISGYLITRILLTEMQSDTFSFIHFYERRARRIIPALLSVTLISSIFAWNILMPDALLEYGQSLLATALFSANIFFLQLDNYTAELISQRPLLHMWSLGIEEQFYIFFPFFLLIFMKKWRKSVGIFLVASFVFSLLIATLSSKDYPGINFYLAPSRIWELIGGAYLSYLELSGRRKGHQRYGNLFSALGFALILGYALMANDGIAHPSILTFFPVLGTILIIWFGVSTGKVIQFLSSKPVVFVGLISYSLYLWHQPVFVMTRIYLARDLIYWEKWSMIFASILLACITYFYVEKTTRSRKITSSKVVWYITGVGTVCMICFGLFIHVKDGFPSRYFTEKLISDAMHGKSAPNVGSKKCKNFSVIQGPCVFTGNNEGGYTFLTVGDSHIRTLDAPIVERLPEMEFVANFIPLNRGTSFFSFGIDIAIKEGKKTKSLGLQEYNQKRMQVVESYPQQIVITGGRLPLYLEHQLFDNLEGGIEPGNHQVDIVDPDDKGRQTLSKVQVQKRYISTIMYMLEKGIKVVVVYPIPEVGWDVPEEMTRLLKESHRANMTLDTDILTTPYEVFRDRSAAAYSLYDKIPEHYNLIRIFPDELLCKDERCYTHDEDHLYYRDDNHLSFYGANKLLDNIIKKMEQKWSL